MTSIRPPRVMNEVDGWSLAFKLSTSVGHEKQVFLAGRCRYLCEFLTVERNLGVPWSCGKRTSEYKVVDFIPRQVCTYTSYVDDDEMSGTVSTSCTQERRREPHPLNSFTA
jgi:hypothetical protein